MITSSGHDFQQIVFFFFVFNQSQSYAAESKELRSAGGKSMLLRRHLLSAGHCIQLDDMGGLGDYKPGR